MYAFLKKKKKILSAFFTYFTESKNNLSKWTICLYHYLHNAFHLTFRTITLLEFQIVSPVIILCYRNINGIKKDNIINLTIIWELNLKRRGHLTGVKLFCYDLFHNRKSRISIIWNVFAWKVNYILSVVPFYSFTYTGL